MGEPLNKDIPPRPSIFTQEKKNASGKRLRHEKTGSVQLEGVIDSCNKLNSDSGKHAVVCKQAAQEQGSSDQNNPEDHSNIDQSRIGLGRQQQHTVFAEYQQAVTAMLEQGVDKLFKNIFVKKIPKVLLDKCQFGVENYNLNIIDIPEIDEDEE
jgi:hypothetical protein